MRKQHVGCHGCYLHIPCHKLAKAQRAGSSTSLFREPEQKQETGEN